MAEYLELNATDCRHCYKCIRNCPVKAIRFSGRQAAIMPDECVLCGRCFVSCPQKAKRIHSDLHAAKALVAGSAPVYASLAPSFVGNYDGLSIAQMDEILRAVGFAGAQETAIGASLVKDEYDRLIELGEQEVIISSCCHTVNMLVERHFPAAIPAMAAVITPMQAHAKHIKGEHPGSKVVFIGPCISKKAEAAGQHGDVDCVLTFDQLDSWLFEAHVEIPRAAAETQAPGFGKTRLFPTTGGILRSIQKTNPKYNYIAVDGMEECIATLEAVSRKEVSRCFIEMSACRGSCTGGPAMNARTGMVNAVTRVHNSAAKRDFAVEPIDRAEMVRAFTSQKGRSVRFSDSAIDEALRSMGKLRPEDELNCGSCGYDTCREKAQAVLAGKASPDMCLPFLMSKAQSFSDTIIRNTPNGIVVLSEEMELRQINRAAQAILSVKNAEDVLGQNVICLLDPTPFFSVLDSGRPVRDRELYLADYDRHISLTVVRDAESGLIIGIMRDISAAETERTAHRELVDETVRVTDEVIAKQMRIVQEIASLLGETAADTKIALTKLKGTLKND